MSSEWERAARVSVASGSTGSSPWSLRAWLISSRNAFSVEVRPLPPACDGLTTTATRAVTMTAPIAAAYLPEYGMSLPQDDAGGEGQEPERSPDGAPEPAGR